ncbi:MAG: dihydroorotase [Kiritimatiellia bacterium]|jgi:dihydroorotase
MKDSLFFSGVRLLDPVNGLDAVRDVLVAEGRIEAIGEPGRGAPPPPSVKRVEGRGLLLAPGFRDVHVHFRDPGATRAETLASGAASAARGGFTHVVTMPNTLPACDSPELLRRQLEADLPVRILPSACLTVGRSGRAAADLEALAAAGAAAFTDDGSGVADDAVMEEAMRRAARAGRTVMDHAVDPALCGPGIIRDCETARRFSFPVMPPEAEVEAVRRDIALCRKTGCRLHIQHVSCAGTVELLAAARREGLPVTGEASPHHLAIAAEDIPGDDADFRMNPPLGTREDVAALRQAVLDGTLPLFATDHAPHEAAAKARGFRNAPSGVLGMETAIGVTYDVMVRKCGMPPLEWARRWTQGPAEMLGLPPPSLREGDVADLVLVDPETPWTVEPAAFASLSRNCPFKGWTLNARAILVIAGGRLLAF